MTWHQSRENPVSTQPNCAALPAVSTPHTTAAPPAREPGVGQRRYTKIRPLTAGATDIGPVLVMGTPPARSVKGPPGRDSDAGSQRPVNAAPLVALKKNRPR